jgi:hypothetical protein
MPASRIAPERRQRIFQALVKLQDNGQTVLRSRAQIAARFQVTYSQIRQIEDEGIEQEWPPLAHSSETAPIPETNFVDAVADEPIVLLAMPAVQAA